MSLFDMKDHALDGIDAVLLTTLNDQALVGLVTEILQDNDIVCLTRVGAADGQLQVLGGYFQSASTDIYVNKPDYDKAKGLLDAYVSGTETVVSDQGLEADQGSEAE